MLHKIAASKRKAQENAALRADREAKGTALGMVTATGPIPAMVLGYHDGKKVGHPVVGTLLGSTGVNGAVAKDTGISTLGTSVRQNSKNYGMIGAGLGAIAGGVQGGVPGVIGGAIGGGITGSMLGGAHGALSHGAGHLLGSNQSHRYRKHKK